MTIVLTVWRYTDRSRRQAKTGLITYAGYLLFNLYGSDGKSRANVRFQGIADIPSTNLDLRF
jgi:hypothetical protein